MTVTTPERTPCVDEDDRMDEPMPQPSEPQSVEQTFDSVSEATPEGWRVELIEGEIHVAPPANGNHEETVTEVAYQVARHGDKALRVYTGIGLFVPDASVTGRVIPDLVVAPKGSFASPGSYHDPSSALLVGEVTSASTGDRDRDKKMLGYALAEIPLYLLIDRKYVRATVFSQPVQGRYTRKETVDLDQVIRLPYPLGFDLDTSEF